MGEVVVPCSTNNTYEYSPNDPTTVGEKYTVRDKFYLPSCGEVCGPTADTITDDSVLFPYYVGADNTDRVKYYQGSLPGAWWLRTPESSRASHICLVNPNGTLGRYGAVNEHYIAPMCTIV